MTEVYQLKKRFFFELQGNYPQSEIESFFYLLTEHFLKKNRVDLALSETLLEQKEISVFKEAIKRLQNYEPIQYIIGSATFYNLIFNVSNKVLIPRPETEELVSYVLQSIKGKSELKIADIGTGSGCIAISLAKNCDAKIYGIDISKEALKIAQKNAEQNEAELTFIQCDILTTDSLSDLKFDVIVSNPPYVRNSDKKEMKPNVLNHEPHLALFVEDENPLLFYDKITDFAKKNLSSNGLLFFEINQYLAKQTIQLIKSKGFSSVELKKDFYENNRMIRAKM